MTSLKELTPEGLAANLLFEKEKIRVYYEIVSICNKNMSVIYDEFKSRGLISTDYEVKNDSSN